MKSAFIFDLDGTLIDRYGTCSAHVDAMRWDLGLGEEELQRAGALRAHIPDVEVLLALEPEELAAKVIFLLRREQMRASISAI